MQNELEVNKVVKENINQMMEIRKQNLWMLLILMDRLKSSDVKFKKHKKMSNLIL